MCPSCANVHVASSMKVVYEFPEGPHAHPEAARLHGFLCLTPRCGHSLGVGVV